MSGSRWSGAELVDVEISGEVQGLRVNGVDVGPLVEAELDRRHPERALIRPTDAARRFCPCRVAVPTRVVSDSRTIEARTVPPRWIRACLW